MNDRIDMHGHRSVLFVCESYYLRFYRPLADHLRRLGFKPVWVALDTAAPWPHESIDPAPAIEALAETRESGRPPEQLDAICAFERAVFERPNVFKDNYPYTINTVRTFARARRLAEIWYDATLALINRFAPSAVFLWNGRYLPYSAVSGACAAVGQPFFTSEIGWLPGTIFVDRGPLSTNTTDLAGRRFEEISTTDFARADAFLEEYRRRRATMVSQTVMPASEVRQRLLGPDGTFLLLYGCQVDWDTNVVIGARRFHSNEAAVRFLLDAVSAVPGGRLIVKTHPLDSDKKEDLLRDLLSERGAVISDIHPHVLIEAADCVAVRNSTLGFEALCYGKPLIALEQAKYRHPNLTLAADSADQVGAALLAVSRGDRQLPDRTTFQQFILHVLDRYLVPVSYDYFFEPATLQILSHLRKNESLGRLSQLLSQVVPPVIDSVDDAVSQAINGCELRKPQRPSFLHRQVRRLADWMS